MRCMPWGGSGSGSESKPCKKRLHILGHHGDTPNRSHDIAPRRKHLHSFYSSCLVGEGVGGGLYEAYFFWQRQIGRFDQGVGFSLIMCWRDRLKRCADLFGAWRVACGRFTDRCVSIPWRVSEIPRTGSKIQLTADGWGTEPFHTISIELETYGGPLHHVPHLRRRVLWVSETGSLVVDWNHRILEPCPTGTSQ